jgi:hypothetical protein
MRRIVLALVLLLFLLPAAWHIMPSSEPDGTSHPRPSAAERTMANLLSRLNLATGWAKKVNEREIEWLVGELLRETEHLRICVRESGCPERQTENQK